MAWDFADCVGGLHLHWLMCFWAEFLVCLQSISFLWTIHPLTQSHLPLFPDNADSMFDGGDVKKIRQTLLHNDHTKSKEMKIQPQIFCGFR